MGLEPKALLERILRSMTHSLAAALQTAVLAISGVALAMPTNLACCSGLVAAHGASCCEASSTDALARACCAGEAGTITLHPDSHVVATPVAAPIPAAAPPLASQARPSRRLAIVPSSHQALFQLHSALLL